MTNNPDRKAPDRVFLPEDSLSEVFEWEDPEGGDILYIRECAFTPQQAAKVLLESMMGDEYQMSATAMDLFLDALHSENNRAKMFFAALKALAESKE